MQLLHWENMISRVMTHTQRYHVTKETNFFNYWGLKSKHSTYLIWKALFLKKEIWVNWSSRLVILSWPKGNTGYFNQYDLNATYAWQNSTEASEMIFYNLV